MPPSVLGMVLMFASTIIFALQDAVTKLLVQDVPVAQIVFVRFAAFAVFALSFAAWSGGIGPSLRSRVPLLQLLRCVIMCSEIALFALSLRYLGLAEVHAILACFPLVVAALSVPILGEKVGPRRWAAVVIGFIGTLIILRPGLTVFNPYVLLPLSCAVIYALYNLLTRQVSRHDSFATSLVYFGVVGALLSGLVALPGWQPVSRGDGLLLAVLCCTSISAHMMLIKALQLTEAIVLQPFNYLVLLWAMLIAFLFFKESIDLPTIVGAAIVVASGVYVAYRETLISRRNRTIAS